MQKVTFKELIAHPPLVMAWGWEMICIAAALYAGVFLDNYPVMFGILAVGVLPFTVVLLMFLNARRESGEGRDQGRRPR